MHISVHSGPVSKIDLITKYNAQYKHLWSSVSVSTAVSYYISSEIILPLGVVYENNRAA